MISMDSVETGWQLPLFVSDAILSIYDALNHAEYSIISGLPSVADVHNLDVRERKINKYENTSTDIVSSSFAERSDRVQGSE